MGIICSSTLVAVVHEPNNDGDDHDVGSVDGDHDVGNIDDGDIYYLFFSDPYFVDTTVEVRHE
jgi:hypothetical protein